MEALPPPLQLPSHSLFRAPDCCSTYESNSDEVAAARSDCRSNLFVDICRQSYNASTVVKMESSKLFATKNGCNSLNKKPNGLVNHQKKVIIHDVLAKKGDDLADFIKTGNALFL